LVGFGHDLVGVPVLVPGDYAGALALVRGGELLAHEGVEQRGLAGLDLPGDGHAQRRVEAGHDLLQALALGGARVEGARLVGKAPGPGGEVGHRAAPAWAATSALAGSCSWAMRPSSASMSRSRLSRSAWVRLAASWAERS